MKDSKFENEVIAKKDYGHAAACILNALENGKVPITWHEINRQKLEQEIAQELARLDSGKEEAQDGD